MDGFLRCATGFYDEPDLDASKARTILTKLELLENENRFLELDLITQQEAFQQTILVIEDDVSQLKYLLFKLENIIDDSSKSVEPVLIGGQSLRTSTIDPYSSNHKNEEPVEGDTDRYISYKLKRGNLGSISQIISKAQDLRELLFKTTEKLMNQQNKFQDLSKQYRSMDPSEHANGILEEKSEKIKVLETLLTRADLRVETGKKKYRAKISEMGEIIDRSRDENVRLNNVIEGIKEELEQSKMLQQQFEENNRKLKLKMDRKLNEAEKILQDNEMDLITRLNDSESLIKLLKRDKKELKKDVVYKDKMIQEYREVISNRDTLNDIIKRIFEMNNGPKRCDKDLENIDRTEDSFETAAVNLEADEKGNLYGKNSEQPDEGCQMKLDFQNIVMKNNVLLVSKLNLSNVLYM